MIRAGGQRKSTGMKNKNKSKGSYAEVERQHSANAGYQLLDWP